MKRIIIIVLAAVLISSLASCALPVRQAAEQMSMLSNEAAGAKRETKLPYDAACLEGLGFTETPLASDALSAYTGIARNYFIGDLIIRATLPGWEVELTPDKGQIQCVSGELKGEKTLTRLCGDEELEFSVFDPEGDFSNLPENGYFGHLRADNVIVRAVLYREGAPAGYAVIAAWGKYGNALYNARVIKAVELTAPEGASVTEEQVNALIDKTIYEEIEQQGLFGTELFDPPEGTVVGEP
ncbi:MAG: hypothetical protein J6P98_08455 [Clostridia bacterium]|nr:hypothetical protein [Clostridia bacterium]